MLGVRRPKIYVCFYIVVGFFKQDVEEWKLLIVIFYRKLNVYVKSI